jgi:flagellar motor switch protein FliG
MIELSKIQVTEEIRAQVIEEFLQTQEGGGGGGGLPGVGASPFGFQLQKGSNQPTGGPAAQKGRPLDFLRGVDPKQLLRIIRKEHPQTIAVILSCLHRQQASAVLGELTPAQQAEVARRLAEIGKINPDVMAEIERVLESRLHSLLEGEFPDSDGKEALLEILNQADRGTEDKIISGLSVKNPSLAGDLKAKLCDFEDLINIEDASLQQVLRLTDLRDLCIALKGANKDLAERIYRCMPPEAARALRSDVERVDQPSWQEMKAAQQQIRNILRGLVALQKIKFKN